VPITNWTMVLSSSLATTGFRCRTKQLRQTDSVRPREGRSGIWRIRPDSELTSKRRSRHSWGRRLWNWPRRRIDGQSLGELEQAVKSDAPADWPRRPAAAARSVELHAHLRHGPRHRVPKNQVGIESQSAQGKAAPGIRLRSLITPGTLPGQAMRQALRPAHTHAPHCKRQSSLVGSPIDQAPLPVLELVAVATFSGSARRRWDPPLGPLWLNQRSWLCK